MLAKIAKLTGDKLPKGLTESTTPTTPTMPTVPSTKPQTNEQGTI
jgi:hypothetical protein